MATAKVSGIMDDALLDILRHRNPWWHTDRASLALGFSRFEVAELAERQGDGTIVTLLGMRRVGKTGLLRQLIGRELDAGRPPTELLLIDFEDILLLRDDGLPTPKSIWDVYIKTFHPERPPLLLLDEVQAVNDWARWVRWIHETGQARCVVTGSASRLLEPELASILTGRQSPMEIHPLAFKDFLRFRHLLEESEVDAMNAALLDYLRFGGLPGVALMQAADQRERRLSEIFDDILRRDVMGRLGLRQWDRLRALALTLLRGTGTRLSEKKLADKLGLSSDTVRSWLDALTDSRLIRRVRRLDAKIGIVERAEKKVYAGDLGLRHATTLRFSPDLGHLAETAVYLHLARLPAAEIEVRYWESREGFECDFVLWHHDHAAAALQVCWDADGPIPARELRGLQAAMAEWGLTHGTLVTARSEGVEVVDGGTVELVPLHKWLLRSPSMLVSRDE